MSGFEQYFLASQRERNAALLDNASLLGRELHSATLPLHIDIAARSGLSPASQLAMEALQIEAARTAIESLASLATIGEMDHLGGGLELIPALTLSLALSDGERVQYTIEHAHTSIGYFAALAAFGYVPTDSVVESFRRGIEITGHVSWLPGGTQLNGGRLGVIIPVAVGQALGLRANLGAGAWVLAHCGDAGWIAGQALNGFNGADLHNAPITFVMHRNGIQLSGSTRSVMDKDPRGMVEAMGVTIIETPSLHDLPGLYEAYRQAYDLAREGRPSMIYPTGEEGLSLEQWAERLGIAAEAKRFAAANGVASDTKLWVPGSLMSYRDPVPMLECLFLVNDLPGGAGHHDGHMKGRKVGEVLDNPMLQMSSGQHEALASLRARPPRRQIQRARPAVASPNLLLSSQALEHIQLPEAGTAVSARVGTEAAYAALARAYPEQMFVVSCDLDVSTKLAKAVSYLPPRHQFEMSIEEQAAALMANGLALATPHRPQLTVFSTFAAFFEGIAREGFEFWRYQRNLNGVNEGLNVAFHLSHVGANTGRDHFSGWGLDWITLALGYLPYLHRFYAPCDALSAFAAVRDMAAHYGGHIIGIPRDKLPVLRGQDGSAVYDPFADWQAVTPLRRHPGARHAILAMGAPAGLAGEAADQLTAGGLPVDAIIINGLPLAESELHACCERYRGGLVTIEDGIIGTRSTGLRGFAGLVAGLAHSWGIDSEHVGIVDPRTAPSDGFEEVWRHFGITSEALVRAVTMLKAVS